MTNDQHHAEIRCADLLKIIKYARWNGIILMSTRLMPVFENADTTWKSANQGIFTTRGCPSKT